MSTHDDHIEILRKITVIEQCLTCAQSQHNNKILEDMRYLLDTAHKILGDYERVKKYSRHKQDCTIFDVVEFPKCSCGYAEL